MEEALVKSEQNEGRSAVAAVAANPQPVQGLPRRVKYNYKLSAKDDDYILKAIEEHKTLAFMAQQIGCCRQALAEYIHKDPILQQAFTDAKDGMDDLAELRLFEKINQGDLGAIMFYMPRKMRHRGYGDQPLVEQGSDAPRVVIGKIDDEELKEAELTLAEIPVLGVDENGNPTETSQAEGNPPSAADETDASAAPADETEGDSAEYAAEYSEDGEAYEDEPEMGDPLFG